jgi:hypothetical protein
MTDKDNGTKHDAHERAREQADWLRRGRKHWVGDREAGAGAGARAREEGVKESLPPRGDPGGMAVNRLRFHAKHRLLLLGDVFHALCFGEGATVGIEPALYRRKKLHVRKAEQLIPRHVRDYRKV